jgi:hypothetical protein
MAALIQSGTPSAASQERLLVENQVMYAYPDVEIRGHVETGKS